MPVFDNVPMELRSHARWVLWRYVLRADWKPGDPKPWTKVPYRADGKGKASSTDAGTWSSFDVARDAYERGLHGADGVGWVIGEGIVGGDIDGCRDPQTGTLRPEAERVVRGVDTYTEASPSGAGVRLFALGELPLKGRKRGGYEMYDGDGGRYLTVTGARLDGAPSTIHSRSEALARVHAQHIAHAERPKASVNDAQVSGRGRHLSDAEVLEAMRRNRRNGAELGRLYAGDLGAYGGDHSAADMALVRYLAWWTDYDHSQVDRLFRNSKLMRDKWDAQRGALTYGERTVAAVFQGHGPGDGYRPSDSDDVGSQRCDEAGPGPVDGSVPSTDTAASNDVTADRNPPKQTAPQHRPLAPLMTAAELMRTSVTPLEMVIEDLLLPGLNVLAGKPKVGKSWLSLGMCLKVATGSPLWNRAAKRGRAIYYGLKDSTRRLQTRLLSMGHDPDALARLDHLLLGTELPRLDAGGREHLHDLLVRYPDTKLLVIDTLARVRPSTPPKGSAYDVDSLVLADLQRLALDHDVALLAVTHLRKMPAEDRLDRISGSVGITGTADSVIVLERQRGQGDAILAVESRDFEGREDALKFDAATCTWQLLGSAAEYTLSKQKQLVVAAVRALAQEDEAASPKAVAAMLDGEVSYSKVRQLLPALRAEGLLRDGGYGRYLPPDEQDGTGNSGSSGSTRLPYNDE